jgi:hypothetical protein
MMIRRLALCLVAALSFLGCGSAMTEYTTPWFRLVTPPRYTLAPHAIEWGGYPHPEIRVGWWWHELAHGTSKTGTFGVHPIGDAVAVSDECDTETPRNLEDGLICPEPGPISIYREGSATPIRIPSRRCWSPMFSKKQGEITCFTCADGGGLESRPHACETLHIETLDSSGRSVSVRTVPSPAEQPVVEGRLPTGEWIVAERKTPKDFLLFDAPDMRFRLDPTGFQPLPFGADPFGREVGTQEEVAKRTAEILREMPIRDASLAVMRTGFAEDEHAHPTWVLREELANKMREHQGMEPDVTAQAGACYTLVARASEGLTRLDLSLHQGTPDVPDWPPPSKGLLGMASGASPAVLSHCVAPGDPPVLHLRVGAGVGVGYVVARIYQHPPP